jgi:hypothetical protein
MNVDITQGYSLLDTKEWWDAVCPGEWDEARIEQDGVLQARLPFLVRKKMGFSRIGLPFLTPWAGPYFSDSGGKPASQLAREISLGQQIAAILPFADVTQISCPATGPSLFGFVEAGYTLGATYTYNIDLTKPIEELWDALLPRTRQNIRKAEKLVHIETDSSADHLIKMVYATFDRQGIAIDKNGGGAIDRVQAFFGPLNMAHIFTARGHDGAVHASILCVCDGRHVIYSCGGADPALRSSNAQSLLLWHAIKTLKDHAPVFEFAGSMSPTISHFFLSFGGKQVQKIHAIKTTARFALAELTKRGVQRIRHGLK